MFLLKRVISLCIVCCAAFCAKAQTFTLNNAFSHNDYWRKHPLYDALSNGYTYVEADIYLRRKKLVVAHILPCFHRKSTLEKLYLEPLLTGSYGDGKELPDHPVTLLIDIKSNSAKTYRALDSLLAKYSSIITSYDDGVITRRKVTIVISGHRPYALLRSQRSRRAFLDEDLRRSCRDSVIAQTSITASCKYKRLLSWSGKGEMPEMQKERLCRFIQAAHQNDEKVRLYASPENAKVWDTLLSCGVDLINTDKIVKLKNFLLSRETPRPIVSAL